MRSGNIMENNNGIIYTAAKNALHEIELELQRRYDKREIGADEFWKTMNIVVSNKKYLEDNENIEIEDALSKIFCWIEYDNPNENEYEEEEPYHEIPF